VVPVRPNRGSQSRPDWQLGPDPISYREVELLERYVHYSVDLGSSARRSIVEEIARVQRKQGECDCGGWLFSQYPPKASSDWVEIAYANGAGDNTRASSRQVFLGDPFDALAEVGRKGLGHLQLVGDWHCHTIPGSELPSLQGARAGSGTMGRLGRTAYVSLLVSPSEDQGWLSPRASAPGSLAATTPAAFLPGRWSGEDEVGMRLRARRAETVDVAHRRPRRSASRRSGRRCSVST
jgi:hypothetical protein